MPVHSIDTQESYEGKVTNFLVSEDLSSSWRIENLVLLHGEQTLQQGEAIVLYSRKLNSTRGGNLLQTGGLQGKGNHSAHR